MHNIRKYSQRYGKNIFQNNNRDRHSNLNLLTVTTYMDDWIETLKPTRRFFSLENGLSRKQNIKNYFTDARRIHFRCTRSELDNDLYKIDSKLASRRLDPGSKLVLNDIFIEYCPFQRYYLSYALRKINMKTVEANSLFSIQYSLIWY